MKDKIEEAINLIRPSLQADGGDIELVDFDEKNGIVKVKLTGACHDCPMAQITLQEGVGRVLKEKVSGIKEVMAV